MTAVSTETPISASSPSTRGDAERRMRELQRDQRAHRLGHNHAESDRDRKLEIAVEREKDHENQQHRERRR